MRALDWFIVGFIVAAGHTGLIVVIIYLFSK